MARFDAPPPVPGGKLPDCAGMKKLRQAGWTYADIEMEYGVSNQSVHRAMRRCGLAEAHPDYSSVIPWVIRPEHRTLNVNILLRAAAREKMGVGRKLSAVKQRELDNWLEKLESHDAVIYYGLARDNVTGEETFGFHYVPRRHGIDDWIIHKPKAWVERDREAS